MNFTRNPCAPADALALPKQVNSSGTVDLRVFAAIGKSKSSNACPRSGERAYKLSNEPNLLALRQQQKYFARQNQNCWSAPFCTRLLALRLEYNRDRTADQDSRN